MANVDIRVSWWWAKFHFRVEYCVFDWVFFHLFYISNKMVTLSFVHTVSVVSQFYPPPPFLFPVTPSPELSCPQVTKRDEDSSLMQLKEEFRTYEALRREHDAQIVHIAMEAGLRISPEQWSSLLYGDLVHKSHMQSIIDKVPLWIIC